MGDGRYLTGWFVAFEINPHPPISLPLSVVTVGSCRHQRKSQATMLFDSN
jgi:hypothetical protein